MNSFGWVAGTFKWVAIAVLMIVAAFPFYWMFNTALLPSSEMFNLSPTMVPHFQGWGGFAKLSDIALFSWIKNTFVVALGTTVLCLLIALFTAYSLSRYRFRGKGAFGFVLFSTQMLPEALLLVPLYLLFLGLGLLNSLFGLVLVNVIFVMPVAVFILKSAIDRVPLEVEEAARMDGSSRLTIQMSVVWPLIFPSIAAASILAFFHAWNEFLVANTFIQSPDKKLASTGIAGLVGQFVTPLDTLMASGIVYTVPAIVFFLLAQRQIVGGLTAGSVKG